VRCFPDNTLVWGYFNEQNVFQEQGSKSMTVTIPIREAS
jgi:hypothetical protein